ncbi:NB-ARC domain-containing protein [Streptomyces sp. NPDC018029]|uniref:NB-ARC domain-containing protein n=1 Tax=Streptomyces sp. NPDC018029 TaxID=3365032 RepID=UPI00379684E1
MPQVLQPGKARTMDEFIAELRLLKAWGGNPSVSEITRRVHAAWQRAGRPRSEWPARSTVGNCFQVGRRRPNTDLLLAVVHALVGADTAAFATWRLALHAVLGEAEAASRATAYDRLPDGPPEHVTRHALLQQAKALIADAPGAVLALQGMAGSGKTALALDLGRRLLASAPAAAPTLYADLHGRDSDKPATNPAAVLDTFLRLLGVAGDRIPRDLEARSRLFSQLLHNRGALVVLDDVAEEAQLRPLLPRERTCRVLVTSRRVLQGSDGMATMHVPAFTPQEAADLLLRTAGPGRADADPEAVRLIAERLDHHPLALSVIGRHLREHPAWGMPDYRGEPLRLLAMEGGVREPLSRSVAQLAPHTRHALRLIALHPPRDIDIRATAALLGSTVDAAEQDLAALAAEHLIQQSGPGIFRIPRLTRAYAEERLGIDEPASVLRRAARQLQEHFKTAGGQHAALARPRIAGVLPEASRVPAYVRYVWQESALTANAERAMAA